MIKAYKLLTYEQQCQIYILKITDNTQQDITNAVGASQSTISRELKRNSGLRGYRNNQAQNLTETQRIITAISLE